MNQFETVYTDCIVNGKRQSVIEDYENRLFIIGRQVLVVETAQSYSATVVGVDASGALIVKDSGGKTRLIVSGEIQLEVSQ
jgi:biotin-(acetyl-CoA carboxylase) ligase